MFWVCFSQMTLAESCGLGRYFGQMKYKASSYELRDSSERTKILGRCYKEADME